jgi:YteA family regulatory protein
MNGDKLNDFRQRLLAEKRRIEIEWENSNRFNLNQSLTDSVEELSAYDNHPADLATETFEREKDLALWNSSNETYNRINEALDRIDAGVYGQCELCGEPIHQDRLEALPYTTLCFSCAKVTEEQYINRERPVEEEVLEPPFARTFLDDTDYVATDGEDIWQSVARYGTSDTPSDLGGTDSYDDNFYDADEDQGIVERVEGVIDVTANDEIPPDPGNRDQQD